MDITIIAFAAAMLALFSVNAALGRKASRQATGNLPAARPGANGGDGLARERGT